MNLLVEAMSLRSNKRLSQAAQRCATAIRMAPNSADAHHVLGVVRKSQGRLPEAIEALRRAAELAPANAEVRVNLGQCLVLALRFDEAERVLREALVMPGATTYGYSDLADCLFRQGRRSEAQAVLVECVSVDDSIPQAHFGLGVLALENDDPAEAIRRFETARALDPKYQTCLAPLIQAKRTLCDWGGLEGLIDCVHSMAEHGEAILPFHYMTIEPDPQRQRRNAERWWTTNAPRLSAPKSAHRFLNPDKSPLVLGYMSGDFHNHATTYLARELFSLHDRGRFRVFGYSYGARDGEGVRARLRQGFDVFHDMHRSASRDIARQIEADGVDILIDLKGFTSGARTDLLALRPAPVLIHYLGYPGTLGGAVDYLIADPYIIPEHLRKHYTEPVALLPGCYQINDRRREVGPAPSRAEVGLPEQATVLCCFNSPYKITPEVFDIWMRLLSTFPHTVLWLMDGAPGVADNLRREAAARGVAPARLVMAEMRSYEQHLARYRLADLVLDTFPVTAHTTASDCLWTGCPILTCVGDSFITRVAGSILTSVGMPELIANSLSNYEAMAFALLANPARLVDLKQRLTARRADAPVFDSARTTRALEGIYQLCWRHRMSELARPEGTVSGARSAARPAGGAEART